MIHSPIYLDHAAATPLWPATRRALARVARLWGNPGSPHAFGRQMRAEFEAARTSIARLLEVRPDELVITAGATESANLAILGVLHAYHADTGNRPHIITTKLDHPAVVAAAQATGAEVTYVAVNARGRVDLNALNNALRPETALVTITAASNELGVIQPIHTIATALTDREAKTGRRPILHTDATQLAAWQTLTAAQLGADLMTLSGAKLGGPVNAGLLYVRRGTRLAPILYGGGQQGGRRPGTEDVAAAVGLAEALRETWSRLPALTARIAGLRNQLAQALTTAFTNATLLHDPKGLPSFIVLALPGLDAEAAVADLDAAGIAVSTGAACTNSSDPFYGQALQAIDQPAAVGHTLRLTLGHRTTARQIRMATPTIIAALERVLSHDQATASLQAAGNRLAKHYARP